MEYTGKTQAMQNSVPWGSIEAVARIIGVCARCDESEPGNDWCSGCAGRPEERLCSGQATIPELPCYR